jgi:UDP-N-acetylmuramoylalanine-D-glutamate ligase
LASSIASRAAFPRDVRLTLAAAARVPMARGCLRPEICLPPALESALAPASLRRVETLDRAVEQAAESARAGEVVLLSPACASFDQFTSFVDRGRTFQRLARALEGFVAAAPGAADG